MSVIIFWSIITTICSNFKFLRVVSGNKTDLVGTLGSQKYRKLYSLKEPSFQNNRQKLWKNYLLVLHPCYIFFKVSNTAFWSIKKAYKVLTFQGLKLNIHRTFDKLLFLGYSIVDKHEKHKEKNPSAVQSVVNTFKNTSIFFE